jgi:hypothetical protein
LLFLPLALLLLGLLFIVVAGVSGEKAGIELLVRDSHSLFLEAAPVEQLILMPYMFLTDELLLNSQIALQVSAVLQQPSGPVPLLSASFIFPPARHV